jgi:membrane fusion protein, multidrug efflux system
MSSSPAPGAPLSAPAGGSRRGRVFVWTVAALIVLTLGLIAWRRHTGAAGSGARNRFAMGGPLPVVTRTARKVDDLHVILNGLGTVSPLATVTVRTQISGQLVQINFQEGQMVAKDDVLAVIDPRPYEAALAQAKGQLMQAEAQLKEAQIDLERYEKLVEQDSISKQQVDAERALVDQYAGVVQTDQALVDNATLNLGYCHVKAPCSGRVGLRQVDLGNYVTPGDSNGLVLLTQLKPISVVFSLAEDYIPDVRKRLNAGAQLRVDIYNRSDSVKLATGTLATIDNTVDTTTGQFKLRAIFPNDDESLFPSQFVTAHMLLDTKKGVIVIPTSGVERGQQGSFVFVVGDDGLVASKTVTLGVTEGERVEVTQGLVGGEKVVVDGADRLRDGMPVVIDTSAPRKPGQGTPGQSGLGWGGQGGGSGWGGHKAQGAPAQGNSSETPAPKAKDSN